MMKDGEASGTDQLFIQDVHHRVLDISWLDFKSSPWARGLLNLEIGKEKKKGSRVFILSY